MAYRIAKQLHKKEDSRGATYTIAYEIHASDLVNFNLKYLADAKWFTGVDSYIYDHDIATFAPNYVVTIKACSRNYDWGGGSGNYATRVKQGIEKTFSVRQFFMEGKFWGVHRATKEDTGIYSGVPDTDKQLKNISDALCKLGDWVFDDATHSSKGTMNPKLSPFSNMASINSAATINEYADHNVMLTTYKVAFPTSKPVNEFESWNGVNGSWGADMAPKTTTSRVWLAIEQDAKEYLDNGIKVHRVTRTMVKAPVIDGTQMLWNSVYDTWTW